ncbi:MAG TPA: radical SAM protein [Thermoplasmatales archaeon]|nr:radical SAM protein [Thermoplasmatales archaeon]
MRKEKRVRFVNAVEATRGCPEKCGFCQYSNIPGGSTFYTRPVEDVIREISMTREKLLYFKDLSMTINPVYAKTLFRGMKGLNKRFICHGNVNVLARDEELVKLAYEAGCVEWTIGFETFSQDTLNQVNKKANKVEEYASAVEKIHKHKMAVVGTFVFGFDEDTPDVFEKTLENIEKLGIDGAIFAVLTPYPGTPLFKKFDEEGRILTRDWSKYNRKDVVFEPKNMSKKELEEGLRWITYEFNSPSKVVYRVSRGFKLGFYPAFAVLAGNLGSMIVGRRKT